MKTRILLIETDAQTIADFQKHLGSDTRQWELDICREPSNALETVRSQNPDIVIGAFKAEGLDGSALLKEIASENQQIERFILADENDKPLLDSEIGNTFHYLPKPCSQSILHRELQRVVALNNWLGHEKVKEIVASVNDFPTLPPVYMKVVNAVNSPNASSESISEAIMGDIAVTAKLLQTVNSSFFGLEEKVSDISHAISILGIESVKNIVLAIQVFGRIEDTDQQALIDQLWHHSMSVAVAAKRIAKYETRNEKKAEEAYTAGLFHDIGKLVLIKSLPNQYKEARELAAELGISHWEAEERIIGCNHADIGAYLLGRWGLPMNVLETTALHHNPAKSFTADFTTLSAVHAANAIVWSRHAGTEPHPDATPSKEYLEHIGRVGAWNEWKDVSVGKTPEKTAPPEAISESTSDISSSSSDSLNTNYPKSDTDSPELESPAKSGNGKALAFAAIAAAVAIAAWLLLPKASEETPGDSFADAKDDWPAEETFAQIDEEEEEAQAEVISELPTEAPAEQKPEVTESQPKGKPIPTIPEEPAKATESEIAETATPIIIEEPEAPAPEVYNTFPKIRLTGIFYNPANPLASVNGKLRRQGDSVSGALILSIEKRYITVSYNDEKRKINLPK